MMTKSFQMEWWRRALVGVSLFALLSNNFYAFGQGPRIEADRDKATHIKTATPIKHVIVLIGENRTFDHLFATYTPKREVKPFQICCRKESSTPMGRRGETSRWPSSFGPSCHSELTTL